MHKQKRPFLHILSFYTKQSNLVVTLQYYNEVALFCFVHSALFMKELVFKIRAPWTYLTHTCSCQIIVSYLDSISQNTNKRPDPTYTRVLVDVHCTLCSAESFGGLFPASTLNPLLPSPTTLSIITIWRRREALYAGRQYWFSPNQMLWSLDAIWQCKWKVMMQNDSFLACFVT